MKKQSLLSRSRGFTLVELLTVIAIIGILAAILIPTVGSVMKKARITAAGSNARQIAQAYNIYALSGPRIKNISNSSGLSFPQGGSTIGDWAGILAIYGGLNDASFYYVSDDPNYPASPQSQVLDSTGTAKNTSFGPGVAYTVMFNTPRSAEGSTTPILWSRDWGSTGAPTNGWGTTAPWGTDGGHIAYLDGHMTWQRTTAEDDTTGDLIIPQGATGAGGKTPDPEIAAGTGITGLSDTPTAVNKTASGS